MFQKSVLFTLDTRVVSLSVNNSKCVLAKKNLPPQFQLQLSYLSSLLSFTHQFDFAFLLPYILSTVLNDFLIFSSYIPHLFFPLFICPPKLSVTKTISFIISYRLILCCIEVDILFLFFILTKLHPKLELISGNVNDLRFLGSTKAQLRTRSSSSIVPSHTFFDF